MRLLPIDREHVTELKINGNAFNLSKNNMLQKIVTVLPIEMRFFHGELLNDSELLEHAPRQKRIKKRKHREHGNRQHLTDLKINKLSLLPEPLPIRELDGNNG